jgi:RimJ/RimL family protein N-acetyltransferase
MRPVRTERIALVPVEGRNARELWDVLNAPDLRKYQDIPRVRAEEFERQVRARPKMLRGGATGRFEWLLRAGDPERPVGWISLRVNDRSPRIGEVGYSLLAEARGQGYASEALQAVIDESFDAGELDEIQACIIPANTASRAVLDRTGFREERLLRSGAVIRGRHVDVLLFSLTRAAWDRMRRDPSARGEVRVAAGTREREPGRASG